MSLYRQRLPQLGSQPFLADGGLETTLVYHEGLELPCFAAFTLLGTEAGMQVLRRYYARYLDTARAAGLGIVLETPTWRANPDWGARLGYDAAALADTNRSGVGLLLEVRAAARARGTPVVVSGNLGPRGDGYRADARMTAREARDYHAAQVAIFAASDADMAAAFTLTYAEEAIGIALAAREHELPVALAFTVETDGRLPSGEPLGEAILRTEAATGGSPAYYMVNCAHPEHFTGVLRAGGAWRERIRGIRANASRCSHAELDAATELDAGDPLALAAEYQELHRLLPWLTVFGGCCGTDHRHVEAIGAGLLAQRVPGAVRATA